MSKSLIGAAVFVLAVRSLAAAQSPILTDYAVFGDRKVTFATRVQVADGDIGSNGAVVLGRACRTEPRVDVASDMVRVGEAALVLGPAHYNTLKTAAGA